MSTWTSSVAAGLAALALVGCTAGLLAAPADGPRTQAVQVGDARVVLAAPAGFCMDARGSRPADTPPVILFARCGAGAAGRPPAIVTATATPAGPGAEVGGRGGALHGFLRSPAGRAALSRSGSADSVTVLGSVIRDSALIVHLRDRSPAPAAGVSSSYRRAFLDVPGALVSLAVLGFDVDPLSDVESRALLAEGIAAIRAANAAAAAPVAMAAGN